MLGAIAGGAGKETLNILSNISDMVGIAYQLKDDLDDYYEKQKDITTRKFSFLLSLLFENISPQLKKKIFSDLKNGNSDTVIQVIDRQKIPGKSEDLVKQYVKKVQNSVNTITILELKLALYEVLGKIFSKYL